MIQEFLEYQKTNKGLSNQTIEGYKKELKAFLTWAQPQGLRWSTITPEDMTNYVRHEAERGMEARTIRRRVEVVRLLYKYMQNKGMINTNPAWYTETPKVRESLRTAADMNTLDTYLRTPAMTRESHLVHFLIALIADTGMRMCEILKMRGSDIDTNTQSIKIQGKGQKERYVFYGKRFERYAEMCKRNANIIINESDITLRYMMYAQLGNNHTASPHTIRHAFACEKLAKGMPLKTLSVLMGHTNIKTTEIYAKMSTATLAKEYQKYN